MLVVILNCMACDSVGQEAEYEGVEPTVSYAVVDTGQDTCYDAEGAVACPEPGEAFFGQDAQNDGSQPSYVVSADGLTVYDEVTGLTWVRSPDTNGDGELESPADKLTWEEAQSYPDVLNAAKYGGYDDWRLPSIKELFSLILFSGED
ncbi:MAG: DUF1566 domain-containing protein, partial [Rhodothermales bacterium]|nr:DUF1566 domain-containing protein [Rhodothermales bacterium]